MKFFTYTGLAVLAFGGAMFFVFSPRTVSVQPITPIVEEGVVVAPPEAEVPEDVEPEPADRFSDIAPQDQLLDPPEVVKGIYLTGWTAGGTTRLGSVLDLIDRTEINAVVIDIKDYSGHLSYHVDIPLAKEIGADKEIRIARPNALIKKLHDRGVYVIARQTVMQDPILAETKPEWALQDKANGGIWRDNKGLGWVDPAAKGAWDYNVAIANDALNRGFDEVNLDYVRFASDGNLSNIGFPVWEEDELKTEAIARFFEYMREHINGTISADLFGLTTVNYDGLGIGQLLEDAYKNFDYVSPMIYPSHYASGFIGLENPGAHPREVIAHSMNRARERLAALQQKVNSASSATSTPPAELANVQLGKLRPWLQDFSLRVPYGPDKVRAQIDATEQALYATSSTDYYAGWLLWDPSNTYTESALRPALD